MTNWDIQRTRLLHYLLEGNIFLLAILNFTIVKHQEVALGFLLLYIIGGLLYAVFIELKKDITLGWLVTFSPVVILVGFYVLQLPIVLTLVFTAYLIWRVLGHIQEIDYENEMLLFSTSLLVGLFLFIRFQSIPESKYLFYILLSQLLITILIKINRMYIDMKRQGDPSSKKFAKWGFSATGILLGSGTLLALIFPYIQAGVLFLFKSVISLLAYVIIYPLLWLLGLWNPTISAEVMESFGRGMDDLKPDEIIKQELPDGSIDFTIFYIIGGVIAAVLILIFFFKKLDLKPYLSPALAANAKVVEDDNTNIAFGGRRKYPVPSNEIRKRFHSFESLMVKYDLGRKTYEPVLDWLHRIEFTDVNIDDVKGLYERVRYGELNLSKEEEQHYYKLMDDLTSIAKEKSKEMKKVKKLEKKAEKKDKKESSVSKQIKDAKRKNNDAQRHDGNIF